MRTLKSKSHILPESFGFGTCTDYGLLWDLVFKGKRIPAWIVHTDEYEEPIWDIIEIKQSAFSTDQYVMGVRGYGIEGFKQTKEEFIEICEYLSLHFILPNLTQSK